ncbi:cytochrome P450 [Mangrovimicrobium sediminis]|uniref:Cytochrome P450 n=1 Tax=Mangrovimicrobium sediminis TaxID=2562682 RepID=A0A4Z0LVH0_9GAMM|nr:cytochrome P450 [Haliea sp. SAOS-164]TGD71281.1 cytochrome P450 [Haliea sp. SAOS-164]
MANAITAEDERYSELFDVVKETTATGGDVFGDLTPRMNALREAHPVHAGSLRELLELPPAPHHMYDNERPHFTLFNYALCNRALRENLLFSSEVYEESPGVRQLGKVILKMVGDEHLRYRKMVQPMFIRPKAINWWRKNWIESAVEALMLRLETLQSADLNLDLCARLPVSIVTQGMGLAGEDALTFRTHLQKSMMARSLPMEEVMQSAMQVQSMLMDVIAARRAQPQDDVVSALVACELELADGGKRPLEDDEIFAYCRLIILAGGGTTWRQLGITLYQLLSNYHFWEACREDRSLIEPAIEESARWMPTDPTFPRLVTEDIELEGVQIPAGARIDMCLGAANRDPDIWDNPDEYDIFRPRGKQPHLGFGMGPHRCLGMEVAKQEMVVAIDALLERFPNLALDPEAPQPQLLGGLEQRGMSAIPVTLR